MLPKLTPWFIAQATRNTIAPVISWFTYWKTYWETVDIVRFPESPMTKNAQNRND